ncbi:CbiX/SirB N-terminal domain-containing protein [Actinoplanes sp. NPDC026670]|uniref:sirohydrochlorin chelatase n=1 Tax=Actinoplanes sp. NPDC026670 TaxID=3154700 RepID=UPI0033C67D7C
MSEYPTLIAVAHGTRSPAGRRQIQELAASVARRRPGLDVRLCYVDVQEPKVADVVAGVMNELKPRRGNHTGNSGCTRAGGHAGGGDHNGAGGGYNGAGGGDHNGAGGFHNAESDREPAAVVVPLLLSCGYHVRVDIAEAVAGTGIPVTSPLGPDDVFLESLRRNLPGRADAIVLASAGSSDPLWVQGIREVAAELPGRVELGYTSGSGPRVGDVVNRLRAEGARNVAIAAYLLAEGLFYRTLHNAGADSVTPPLCQDSEVADLVLRRFDSAILTTVGSGL